MHTDQSFSCGSVFLSVPSVLPEAQIKTLAVLRVLMEQITEFRGGLMSGGNREQHGSGHSFRLEGISNEFW